MKSDVMDAEGSLHQKPREIDVMDAKGSLHQKPRENDVMDAEGSLHQKPRESDVRDAEGSLRQKPRESNVMDAEGSLHQKPREVCITEDNESIDLGWFENTKLNRVKNGTRRLIQVGVRDWDSLGTSPSMIQKGFCETVAEVTDAEAEGEGEIHPSK